MNATPTSYSAFWYIESSSMQVPSFSIWYRTGVYVAFLLRNTPEMRWYKTRVARRIRFPEYPIIQKRVKLQLDGIVYCSLFIGTFDLWSFVSKPNLWKIWLYLSWIYFDYLNKTNITQTCFIKIVRVFRIKNAFSRREKHFSKLEQYIIRNNKNHPWQKIHK